MHAYISYIMNIQDLLQEISCYNDNMDLPMILDNINGVRKFLDHIDENPYGIVLIGSDHGRVLLGEFIQKLKSIETSEEVYIMSDRQRPLLTIFRVNDGVILCPDPYDPDDYYVEIKGFKGFTQGSDGQLISSRNTVYKLGDTALHPEDEPVIEGECGLHYTKCISDAVECFYPSCFYPDAVYANVVDTGTRGDNKCYLKRCHLGYSNSYATDRLTITSLVDGTLTDHRGTYSFLNGRLHKEDGPAKVLYDKLKKKYYEGWFYNGKLHRIGGPAESIYDNNVTTHKWFQHGQRMEIL